MERVAPDGMETVRREGGATSHDLAAALGTTGVAVTRYRVAPGERLPAGLHAHADQEEVFVVLAGDATFEMLLPAATSRAGGGDGDGEPRWTAGEESVGTGEAVRFEPGDFQAGRNDGDAPLDVLALGAPRGTQEIRIPVACPVCAHAGIELDTGGERLSFGCPDCGAERVPAPCPACGGEDLRVTLRDPNERDATASTLDAPVEVVCDDCETTYDRPPVRGTW